MLQDNVPGHRARPYFEVWFLKLNAAPADALWIRYTTMAPADAARPERGELWAIVFDPTGRHRAARQLYGMDQVGLARDPLIRLGAAELSDGHAAGAVGDVSWDLRWTPSPTTFHHVPALLRGVLPTTVCSPNVDIAIDGWFQVGDRRVECRAAPAQQGHIRGARYGHSWSWGHCNAFGDGTVFEGVTAQLELGPILTPPLTSLMVRWRGADHVMNGPLAMLTTPSAHELGSWRFTATSGDLRFQGALTARREDIVCVAYDDTDGSQVFCHNTKIGSMTLEITSSGRTLAHLEANGTAALEYTSRQPLLEVRAG